MYSQNRKFKKNLKCKISISQRKSFSLLDLFQIFNHKNFINITIILFVLFIKSTNSINNYGKLRNLNTLEGSLNLKLKFY